MVTNQNFEAKFEKMPIQNIEHPNISKDIESTTNE